MSMLKPATSNSFPKRTELASALVIIDSEPKYKIFQIVNSKLDHQWACKLLYKVICLGYEDTEDKFEWIPVYELTHATNLISDFHITYPAKSSLLSLF